MLTEYPEKGVLLTSAVKSDGGNGFSALESPHVMPTGASQHHHSMRENALFPPHGASWKSPRDEGRVATPRLANSAGMGLPQRWLFVESLVHLWKGAIPPQVRPISPPFSQPSLCGAMAAAWGSQDR